MCMWKSLQKSDVLHFLTTFLSASLIQHVIGSTHDHRHTLDLVISRETDDLITDCHTGSLLSDHHVVSCTVQLLKPQPVKTRLTTCKVNRVECESFKCDLLPRFESQSCSNIQELVDLYKNSIRETLDIHAPLKTSVRSDRPRQPWYYSVIHVACRERRRHERKWRKSRLHVHRQLYVALRQDVLTFFSCTARTHGGIRCDIAANRGRILKSPAIGAKSSDSGLSKNQVF